MSYTDSLVTNAKFQGGRISEGKISTFNIDFMSSRVGVAEDLYSHAHLSHSVIHTRG